MEHAREAAHFGNYRLVGTQVVRHSGHFERLLSFHRLWNRLGQAGENFAISWAGRAINVPLCASIPHAAKSETSENCWKLWVMSDVSAARWVVES